MRSDDLSAHYECKWKTRIITISVLARAINQFFHLAEFHIPRLHMHNSLYVMVCVWERGRREGGGFRAVLYGFWKRNIKVKSGWQIRTHTHGYGSVYNIKNHTHPTKFMEFLYECRLIMNLSHYFTHCIIYTEEHRNIMVGVNLLFSRSAVCLRKWLE